MITHAVITARAGSVRLPGKNMLPVGGVPLALRSVQHAREAGLAPIVTTDIPELLAAAEAIGCLVVSRPKELAGEESPMTHHRAVEHALKTVGHPGGFVLLQPTTPFRDNSVTRACAMLGATRPAHTIYGGHLERHGIWDGNAFAAPDFDTFLQARLRNIPSAFLPSRWEHSLQIDTLSDYESALLVCRQ